MKYAIGSDPHTDEIFLAGQLVQPGLYRELTTKREIQLDHEDYLPASLDGRIACYVAVHHVWGHTIGKSDG